MDYEVTKKAGDSRVRIQIDRNHPIIGDNNTVIWLKDVAGNDVKWSMMEGRKAQTDPEVWKIVSGILYLNCNKTAYEKWGKDTPGDVKTVNTNWLKYKGSN